jgi:signal transduction histidine kinase
MKDTIYTWKFEDKKNRWPLWYIIALSIVIWLSIWWFLTKQYWMSFIILLISWLTYFIENNKEDEIEVNINNLWIKISTIFYDYSKIDSYTFIYNNENAVFLRLNLNKKWIRNIDLYVNNEITEELKNILPNFIKEDKKAELSFSEKLISLLKL